MSTTEKTDDRKFINLAMEPELHQFISEQAKKNDRTIVSQARLFLKKQKQAVEAAA